MKLMKKPGQRNLSLNPKVLWLLAKHRFLQWQPLPIIMWAVYAKYCQEFINVFANQSYTILSHMYVAVCRSGIVMLNLYQQQQILNVPVNYKNYIESEDDSTDISSKIDETTTPTTTTTTTTTSTIIKMLSIRSLQGI
ncbi:hypothetical protein DOY81_001358 [Sarcophaga bullata]|nr:hypothetical protein DOY81_001358 [Sarcophaga bullata]